jgi:hypothetical protein
MGGTFTRRTTAALGSVVVAAVALAAVSATAVADARGSGSGNGPKAKLTRTTGGDGVYVGTAIPVNLRRNGYVEYEYAAAGDATSYTEAGERTPDGEWTFEEADIAPYATRVLVRRPKDPKDFSGTAIVEWMNVSGGVDADPEWATTHEEIIRSGDVWVGVTTQLVGVEGGPVAVTLDAPGAEDAGKGLKAIDPARYGELTHPGDGFAFDIFTQVARAVRAGDGLRGLKPKRVIAAGQSQSAFAMVTYYNGVQPLTEAFDGFFVHSRAGTGMGLAEPGEPSDITTSLGGGATIFRTDVDAPVLSIQTESDVTGVFGSYGGRQDDSRTFRLWEVAGTAHADQHLLGPNVAVADCNPEPNDGAFHVVAKAGLHGLKEWVASGDAPVEAARIEVSPDGQIARDADGIALGGIRTPPVDVPIATLSGAPGPNPTTICLLLGSTIPFSEQRLAELYPFPTEYRQAYQDAVDSAIEAGFVLRDDRLALSEFSDPSVIPG